MIDPKIATDAELAEWRRYLEPPNREAWRRFLARLDKAERELAELKAKLTPDETDLECAEKVMLEDDEKWSTPEPIADIIAAHCAAKVEAAVKPWRELLSAQFHLQHCPDLGCVTCEKTRALLAASGVGKEKAND